MPRRIILLTALAFLLAAGLLASCASEDPTRPSADKREFVSIEPGGDGEGGGGGGGTPPPPELTFMEEVMAAYSNVPMKTIAVTVNLHGDTVAVQPPDWPDSPPFTVIVPLNMTYTNTQSTIWIDYPSGDFDPLAPPQIPGNVTLFEFHGLPGLIEVEFHLPPAPWFDPLILGTRSCFYRFFENADGSFNTLAPEYFTSPVPQATSRFEIFHGAYTYPDNPARGLLDPDEPGDDPDEG